MDVKQTYFQSEKVIGETVFPILGALSIFFHLVPILNLQTSCPLEPSIILVFWNILAILLAGIVHFKAVPLKEIFKESECLHFNPSKIITHKRFLKKESPFHFNPSKIITHIKSTYLSSTMDVSTIIMPDPNAVTSLLVNT